MEDRICFSWAAGLGLAQTVPRLTIIIHKHYVYYIHHVMKNLIELDIYPTVLQILATLEARSAVPRFILHMAGLKFSV
jgi:hypothetical protein